MYRNISDFISEWTYESASTINVLKHLNNATLLTKEYENVRSMAVLAWHITITLSEMLNRTGLAVNGPDEHAKAPASVEEIIHQYELSSSSILELVSEKWSDADLLDEVNMYGEMWKKGTVLSVLIRHQAHHRGQLTVLMRQSGLTVPGVYGPSKEEWAQMNMPAME